MRYRKFKADFLFDGKEIFEGNKVLITDKKGIVENIVEKKDAGDDVEIFEGLISPGFINCHCHLELSHLKNMVKSGIGLVNFLIEVIGNRKALKEDIEEAVIAADKEMYDNGIVGVGDICNTADSLKTKLQSKIQYQNFIEVLGFMEDASQKFATYQPVYNAFCETGFKTNTSIVPHAPYTVSNSMFHLINEASAGKIVSIHNQECIAEDELYKTKTGQFLRLYHHLNINTDFFQPFKTTSLQSYLPLLDKSEILLLVHNTFSIREDIDFALKQTAKTNQQLYWCLCPNANLYIENKLPPVELLKENNCSIVLGTDSYSSNSSLNILDEIKTLQQNFASLELSELLNWSTLNGATALNMNDTLGSFEKGKKPGVILINNIVHKRISEQSTARKIL
jgi:cytosine/adenosine deaminase-related metal-dependent hydrolase